MSLNEGEIMNKNFLLLKDSLFFFKKKYDTLKFDYNSYLKNNSQRLQNMYDSFFHYYNSNQIKDKKINILNDEVKKNKQSSINSWAITIIMFTILIFTNFK